MEQAIGADWGDFARTANEAFLLAFSSLFSIINPIGGALIFYGVTKDFATADREKVAALVGFYSLLIMFGALWAGAYVLRFFGVSIDALRVAGGTVVAVSGWRMLYNPQETEDRKQDHASNAERAKAWGSDVAFFPLTMPFTTGPGTISVAIALSANRPATTEALLPFFAGVCGAAIAIAFTVGACYAS